MKICIIVDYTGRKHADLFISGYIGQLGEGALTRGGEVDK